jgi:hypothetical protein
MTPPSKKSKKTLVSTQVFLITLQKCARLLARFSKIAKISKNPKKCPYGADHPVCQFSVNFPTPKKVNF